MKQIIVDAEIKNVEKVTDFVNAVLERYDCPVKAVMQIDVMIDELFSNIAYYAYAPEKGTAAVSVEMEEAPLSAVITFTDHGKPFDPLTLQEPDVTQSAEERKIGGLGIYLVKKTMDSIRYEYKDGQNILTVKKVMV